MFSIIIINTMLVKIFKGVIFMKDNIGQENPIFYDTKDIANILKCSLVTARQVMSRADFPLIKVGKNFRVNKTAFEEWSLNKRL